MHGESAIPAVCLVLSATSFDDSVLSLTSLTALAASTIGDTVFSVITESQSWSSKSPDSPVDAASDSITGEAIAGSVRRTRLNSAR